MRKYITLFLVITIVFSLLSQTYASDKSANSTTIEYLNSSESYELLKFIYMDSNKKFKNYPEYKLLNGRLKNSKSEINVAKDFIDLYSMLDSNKELHQKSLDKIMAKLQLYVDNNIKFVKNNNFFIRFLHELGVKYTKYKSPYNFEAVANSLYASHHQISKSKINYLNEYIKLKEANYEDWQFNWQLEAIKLSYGLGYNYKQLDKWGDCIYSIKVYINSHTNVSENNINIFTPKTISDSSGENVYTVRGFVQKTADPIFYLRGKVLKNNNSNAPGLFGINNLIIKKYNPLNNSIYNSTSSAHSTWLGSGENGLKIYIGENALTSEGSCQFGFIYGNNTSISMQYQQNINYKYFSKGDIINPVTSIKFPINTININLGSSKKILPVISPSNATINIVNMYSENPMVASINDDGSIKAISPGTTQIIAETQDNGYKTTYTVNVK
jgi:hypothetical protein